MTIHDYKLYITTEYVTIERLENEKNQLINYLEKYYEKSLSENEQKVFKYDIQGVLDSVNVTNIRIKTNLCSSLASAVIEYKQKMSRIHENVIDSKYFSR